MRKSLFLLMILVVSVALAAAQHNPSMPSSDQSSPNTGGRAVSPSPDSPSNSGQATAPSQAPSPSTPSSSADQAAGASKVVEGCLGGSAPDFTVTDSTGTVYKLDIPKDADTSQVAAHVGQSVKVKGMVKGEKASASASPSGASASTSPMIQVEQMARGTSTCPAGATSPSGANSPSGATPPKSK